jgi:hypothetical protein
LAEAKVGDPAILHPEQVDDSRSIATFLTGVGTFEIEIPLG